MAGYLSIPLVLATAVLQVVLSQAGPLSGLKPDMVLVMVAMAGLLMSLRRALLLAFLSGLLLDLFSGMPFGFVTLLLLLIVSLVRLPNRDLVEMNPLVCMILIALVTVFYYGMYGLAMMALGGEPDWIYLLATVVLPSLVMNSLISPIAFVLYRLIGHRAPPVSEDWH